MGSCTGEHHRMQKSFGVCWRMEGSNGCLDQPHLVYLHPLVLPVDPRVVINCWLKRLHKPCLSQLAGNEDKMPLCFSNPLSWTCLQLIHLDSNDVL